MTIRKILVTILAGIVATTLGAPASLAASYFSNQVTYPVEAYPFASLVGDFNQDGKQDLAVCNGGSSSVSILLGNGDGTFKTAVNYSVKPTPASSDRSPYYIVAGDYNGDGRLDLVTANASSSDLSLLLGNGDGTFQTATSIAIGSMPWSIVNGDYNRDGNTDLAVSTAEGNVLLVLNNGNGGFSAPVSYSAGPRSGGPTLMASGDFNGDGILDLVMPSSSSDAVFVLLGKGDGTFQPITSYAVGTSPTSVAVGDVDKDGHADLVVANSGDNTISVLLGNEDGTFRARTSYSTGGGPWSVALVDFNHDSMLDVLVSNPLNNKIGLLQGNRDGTFQSVVSIPVGIYPRFISIGDFNGDGDPDLAVVNSSSFNISILLSNDFQAPVWAGGSSLAVSNLTETGLTLSWPEAGDNRGVTGYQIFEGASVTPIATVGGRVLTYQTNQLSPGTSHVYTVKAIDAAGNVSSGLSQTIKTLMLPPSLRADAISNDFYSPIEISFTDDASWSSAITSIVDGSTELLQDQVDIVSGKLVIHAGVLSEGTHTIRVRASGYTEAMVSQQIGPSFLIGIQAVPQSSSIEIGQQAPITVTATYTSGQTVDVSSDAALTSQDPAIAFVSGSAVRGVSAGSTVVTATYGGAQTNLSITVVPPVLTQLTADPSSIVLQSGQSVATVITATYSNGTLANVTPYVTWQVKPPANVSVKEGLVTGQWAGSTVIQAVYGGLTLDIPVTVTESPTSVSPSNPSPSQPEPKLDIFNPMVSIDRILNSIRNSIQNNQSAAFTDLSNHWSEFNIRTSNLLGIVQGYPDHQFKPNASVTRAEFSSMLVKAFALLEGDKQVEFRDTQGNWSASDIRILASNGVIEGYGDGLFKPNDPITRAEMVTMLLRIVSVDALPAGNPKSFQDIQTVPWAKAQIERAASAGIVQGLDDNRFGPERNASRAESVTLILRTLRLESSIRELLDTIRQ